MISPPPGGSVEGISDVPGLTAALDEKVSHDELDEAIQDLDFPEPVIEQFVTNIAVNETFVTELVTNETYVTELVTQIFEGDEADTYVTQLTENVTYVDNTTTIINNNINGKKGAVSGLAGLDADQQVTHAQIPTELLQGAVNFAISGGGAAITAGTKGIIQIPWGHTLTAWKLWGDPSGSAVIDIWRGTEADHIAGTIAVGDSICASNKPTLSSVRGNSDGTITDWLETGSADDIYWVVVEATPATVTNLTLVLYYTRSV